jgi:tritrans,polycis-undecaprenyl-diphosphate synthase [geranylgeranyl-diphosphate specific]
MSKIKKKYPRHIAIILDGNRRWAKKRGLNPWEGHRQGAKQWQYLKKWMIDLDIKELTLYVFSMQNFERESKEVYFLMKIFENTFNQIVNDPEIDTQEVRIKHIGKKSLLTSNLQKIITKLENKTKKYKKRIVNFCMAYGGQEEIIEAIKKLSCEGKQKIKNIDVDTFSKYLDVISYPDIIIRTSGEIRTSNFLCWQQAYSEWFFLEKMWPDFNKKDLVNIIDEYLGKRKRRYGK